MATRKCTIFSSSKMNCAVKITGEFNTDNAVTDCQIRTEGHIWVLLFHAQYKDKRGVRVLMKVRSLVVPQALLSSH